MSSPVPANEVPANEVPLDEVPANAVPVDEVPANEVPANEVPANEVPLDEVPANEVPLDEVPADIVLPVQDEPLEDVFSPMAQLQQELSSMNLFEGKTKSQINNIREEVEAGLQAFNTIQDACKILHDAIVAVVAGFNTGLRFNPEVARLSDFVAHCKLLVSINDDNSEVISAASSALEGLAKDQRFTSATYNLSVQNEKIGDIGTQISLVLKIGQVFNVPVFTIYVLQNVFDNAKLQSEQATQVVASPLTHNSKTIRTCTRTDLMLELLLYATKSDAYDKVNVLIAHIINELIVSKFGSESSPNEVIQQVCDQLFDLLLPNETAKSLITKSTLIAIVQNPAVKTPDGTQFSDVFPSGQYVKYLGEIAYRASLNPTNQGPIMLPNKTAVADADVDVDAVGEAPGLEEEAPPTTPSHPMTRTDIIVAAFTAANAAMSSSNANIIAAGGAAVSYYIADFVKSLQNNEFAEGIAESGLDVAALEKGCKGIPMNDIDCFVFGEVSREFLMLLSLYMLILYANFYERPKQYGVDEAVRTQRTQIRFNLSLNSSDNVELFMYGNHNNDANTRLISKRLKKNPKVQLVTQETMCFSQLSNPVCGSASCNMDEYYAQPIDLVKKEIDDFLFLYESIYVGAPPDEEKPDLRQLLISQYARNVDNMVSIKTTMLDLVCIFCDEGQSLFIRIFMARKNPKDFARLRVFIEIYLLQLLRKKDATFLEHKDALIQEIKELRVMMRELNQKYYLEQGNIAAVQSATAEVLNADRAAFLTLLRSIGRKIVLIPDPLLDKVPATFRKETGKNTIDFFKNRQNAQIKYPFKMDKHMFNLYSTYMSKSNYEAWLNGVFEELPFSPKVEEAFREKMGKIIDKTQDQTYFEVGFSNMFVRSPEMLRLFNLLNEVKGNDAMFKPGVQRQEKRIFTSMLLGPLRTSMKKYSGIQPMASSVVKLYVSPESKKTLSEFTTSILKGDLTGLEQTINDTDSYDDAVREAIGRIILEWNTTAPRGGATRKHKRVCKFKAKTNRRCVNKGKRRATRRKTKASNKKHRHTRRA